MKEHLHNININNPNKDPRYLWSAIMPKKCKFFLWTILHQGLNTSDKCQARFFSMSLCPNWCILCKSSTETVEHLFLNCSYSKGICRFGEGEHVQHLFSISSLLEFLLQLKINSKAKIIWSNIITTILWCLWLERNRKTFHDKELQHGYLWEDILSLASSWSSKSHISFVIMILIMILLLLLWTGKLSYSLLLPFFCLWSLLIVFPCLLCLFQASLYLAFVLFLLYIEYIITFGLVTW